MPHLSLSKSSLILLAFVAAFVSTAHPAPRSRADSRDEGKVRPEVRAALSASAVTPVLVELRRTAAPKLGKPDIAQARAQVAAEQAQVLAGVPASDFEVTHRYQALPALAGRVNERGLAALAARPEVAEITLDGRGTAAPAVAGAVPSPSVSMIHADEVQKTGVTGAGIIVAVLDTGIDTDNVDLRDDIAYEACFLATGACPAGAHPAEDDNGHGTNVSGIITSDGTVAPVGVAPGAKIAAYKVLDSSGSGVLSDWLSALDDIVANHPEVNAVNMSLQSNLACPGGALDDAITTLRMAGVATFIASGNLGVKDGFTVPACIADGISVGAVYVSNIGSVSGWKTSCTDPTTAADQVPCWSSSADTLDLLAPGARITSTGMGGGLSTYMGTSQATPHAAGVAALLMEAVPGLSVDEIESRIKAAGTAVTDDLHDGDPATNRETSRIDARVALVTQPTATATAPPETPTSTATPSVTPTFTPLPPTATPTPTSIAGDASCDRTVSAVDAALVLQATAGLILTVPCPGGDANGDGRVNAVDAAIILQYVAGLIPILPPS